MKLVIASKRQDRKTGIIACFDADSRCDPNYFVAIEAAFENCSKMAGSQHTF